MSPLNIEVYNPSRNEWIKTGEQKPGDNPGSISNNTPNGREIVIFMCEGDDSFSKIGKSRLGIDMDLSAQLREIFPLAGFEIMKILRNGDSLEMTVQTDLSKEPRRIRFTHISAK